MTGHDVLQGVLLVLLLGSGTVLIVPPLRKRRSLRRCAVAGLLAYAGVIAAAVPAAVLIH